MGEYLSVARVGFCEDVEHRARIPAPALAHLRDGAAARALEASVLGVTQQNEVLTVPTFCIEPRMFQESPRFLCPALSIRTTLLVGRWF